MIKAKQHAVLLGSKCAYSDSLKKYMINIRNNVYIEDELKNVANKWKMYKKQLYICICKELKCHSDMRKYKEKGLFWKKKRS